MRKGRLARRVLAVVIILIVIGAIFPAWSGPIQTVVAAPPAPTIYSPGTSAGPGPVLNTLTPTLQWHAVSGADYYAIGISKYPYGTPNLVYNPQVVYGTSHVVPSGRLEPGERYRWNMQAYGSGDWSAISNTLYFQTPRPPNAPTLDTVIGSSNDIYVRWTDNSDNEEGFIVERRLGTSGAYTQIGTTGANVEIYKDSGLQFGRVYCYRIRAYNSAGYSGYSSEKCGTTLATPALSSPSHGATLDTDTVTLSWSTVTGADAYSIKVSRTSCGEGDVFDGARIGSELVLSGLANGIYYWQVRAGATTYPGLSDYSACRSFTVSHTDPDPDPAGPVSVATYSATGVGETQATLRGAITYFNNNPSAQIRFWYKPVIGGTWTSTTWATRTNTTAYSRTIDGLTPGTEYQFYAQGRGTEDTTETTGTTRYFTTDDTESPIEARIDDYSPSVKVTVEASSSFQLQVWFTNTGDPDHFYPGVSIWDSAPGTHGRKEVFSSYGARAYLPSNGQTSYTWTTSLNTAGEYWLQFAVWDETKTDRLDAAPWLSENLIEVLPPEGPEPVSASISVSKTSAKSGEELTFDGSGSTGEIVSYTWDFDDGRTVEASGTPGAVIHRFRGVPGGSESYIVRLTVKDAVGGQDSASIGVNVDELTKAVSIDGKHALSLPLIPWDFQIPYLVEGEFYVMMAVSYNWVEVRNGENTYIISRIQSKAEGLLGISYVTILKEDDILPMPEIWWQDFARTAVIPLHKTYDLSNKFGVTPVLGQKAPITPLTFHENTDYEITFEGLKVSEYDLMSVMFSGTAGAPLTVVDLATTAFLPDASVEVADEGLLWILDVLTGQLQSPGSLTIYDSKGRVTGLVDGEVREDIPLSVYDEENAIIFIAQASDTYSFEVSGTDDGTYGMNAGSAKEGQVNSFSLIDAPITAGEIHRYHIDWDALARGENGVTVHVDSDGDGTIDYSFTSGNVLTAVETSTGSGTAWLSPSHGSVEDLQALALPPDPPAGFEFPHGMFSFKVTELDYDGQTVTVTVELPSPAPAGTKWWKYHDGQWHDYGIPISISGNTITITLTDGGVGDIDWAADGTITDPGGPGNPMSPLTVGWEGSSVDKAAVIAPWIALLAVIAGASFLILKRRQTQS